MKNFRSALVSVFIASGLCLGASASGESHSWDDAEFLSDPFGCAASGGNVATCNRDAISKISNEKLKTLGYSRARERMFQYIDVYESDSGVRVVDSVYSNHSFAVGDSGIPQNGVNTEHTWPQSYLQKYPRFEDTRSDIYHLFPVESRINSVRGNYQFTECPGEPDETGRVSEKCNGGFEPPEEHKGEVARAMFYLAVTYSMHIEDEQEKVLRQWHVAFPVTDHEKTRAERIQQVQGNVNPFIVHPEWVDLIPNF